MEHIPLEQCEENNSKIEKIKKYKNNDEVKDILLVEQVLFQNKLFPSRIK